VREDNEDTVGTEVTQHASDGDDDADGGEGAGAAVQVVEPGGGGGTGDHVVDDDFAAFEEDYKKSMIMNEEGQADE
jgi:hypothetical protein